MSFKLVSKAMRLDLPRGEKAVLLCLCDFANGEGDAYPSLATISAVIGYGIRQIQRMLRELESKKIIKLVNSGRGGRGKTRYYRINLSKGAILAYFMKDDDSKKDDICDDNDPEKGDIHNRKG